MRPLLFILLLCTCVPAQRLNGDCPPPFRGYAFLNPAVVPFDARLAPFFDRFDGLYTSLLEQPADLQRRANLAEWHERYCEDVAVDDLEALIYGDSRNRLETLRRLLGQEGSTAADLPAQLRGNSFARHTLDYRCAEVVDYLLYAKRIEPLVTAPSDGFRQPAPRTGEMKNLIEEGLDGFTGIESHYLRLRYAYQLIRLAHYLGEYAYALELYDYLMPKVKADPSLIYDWIENHRAGALQRTGKIAESAYLFSRVFDRSPSRRQSAYRSFRIDTDEQWQRALLFCQNDRERAVLHVMRAHNGRAVVIDELEDIYRLDPENRSLQLLAFRELRELERDFLGEDFNPDASRNRRAGYPRPTAADRLVELLAFVNRVTAENRTGDPDFWLLLRGALELLAGDYFYANETLEQLADNEPNDTIAAQADILREVLNISRLSVATDSVELYYYDLLNDDELRARYPDLRPMVNDKLEAVYRRTGQRAKANLLQYGWDDVVKNLDLGPLTQIERLTDSLTQNRFDRALLLEAIGPNAEDDINHAFGLYYLQRGQWENALNYFRQIPTVRIDDYGRFVPFERQFHDFVNVPPRTYQNQAAYNKVELLERLQSLETEARTTTNDTIATQNFFQLGLAHYNMSYFSYNWRVADAFRSATSAARAAAARNPDAVFSHENAPLGNREFFGMDNARAYFERALSRAYNRETAAQVIYYLAKTERNEFYANGRPGGQRPFSYFSLLATEYSDTEYYEYVVAECRTFAWYVGR